MPTLPLHTRMLMGFVVGVCLGLVANLMFAEAAWLEALVKYVADPVGQVFLRLLFMLVIPLLGWLLFNESVDRWTLIGAGIILAANAYIAHREAQLARRAATSGPVQAAKPGE